MKLGQLSVFLVGLTWLTIPNTVFALDPLTGTQYDKQMVIDQDSGPLSITVGMFAACAQDRIKSIVAAGHRRAARNQRVIGEDIDGIFVVTVPGVNEDILFFFEPLGEAQLFLAKMSIAGIIATRAKDKEGAISALIPNCI